MNLGIFSGNLAKNAELRTMPDGQSVANFNMAVESGTSNNSKTMWVDCSLWGKRADGVAPYLVKGIKVTVTGRISLDEYTKSTGGTGYRLKCNVTELDLHGSKSAAPSSADAAPAGARRNVDDDMPF